MSRSARHAGLIGLIAGLSLMTHVAAAARFDVPPVVVYQLQHGSIYNNPPGSYTVRDAVPFDVSGPGAYASGPGFTANLSQFTSIRIRVEAAPGKKFRVNPLAGTLFTNLYWQAPGGDQSQYHSAPTITFENGHGSLPSAETYSFDSVSDAGIAVLIYEDLAFPGAFDFTAVTFEFALNHAVPSVNRTYGSVLSHSTNGFGAYSVDHADPNTAVMELVDIDAPTSIPSTTWGRMKALYR